VEAAGEGAADSAAVEAAGGEEVGVVAVGAAEVAAGIAATAAAEAAIAAGNHTAQLEKQPWNRGAHFAPRFFLAPPLRSLLMKRPRQAFPE